MDGVVSCEDHHARAMSLHEQACLARDCGEGEKARGLFLRAFRFASLAANIGNPYMYNLNRPALHLNAAHRALECGLREEAIRHAEAGMAGDVTPDIAVMLHRAMAAAKGMGKVGAP